MIIIITDRGEQEAWQEREGEKENVCSYASVVCCAVSRCVVLSSVVVMSCAVLLFCSLLSIPLSCVLSNVC